MTEAAVAYIRCARKIRFMSKVILVTGASSGIGQAVAAVLSAKGHIVYGTSRFAQNGEQRGGYTMVKMDVTSEDSVKQAIDFVIEKSGRLNVLINNAGLGLVGPVENISDAEAREIFDTNVFGVLNACRHSISHLRNAKGGYIINITSMAAQIGLPFRGIYSASKFAVEGFTEALSMEVKQFGIKVCLIEPGDFKTNINTTRKVVGFVNKNAYGTQSDDVLALVNKEVDNARTPEVIGYKIASIISSDNPALRYRVATLMQRFSLTLMRILPSRIFEKLVMSHYKMKS
jgi:NAD(P)-dependent dehydrogenase (short-subunit alcohol dehydrogenase family)